jgi:hypothetical protein
LSVPASLMRLTLMTLAAAVLLLSLLALLSWAAAFLRRLALLALAATILLLTLLSLSALLATLLLLAIGPALLLLVLTLPAARGVVLGRRRRLRQDDRWLRQIIGFRQCNIAGGMRRCETGETGKNSTRHQQTPVLCHY